MLYEVSQLRKLIRESTRDDVLRIPQPDFPLTDVQRADVRRWYVHSLEMLSLEKISRKLAEIILSIPEECERYEARYPQLTADYLTEETRVSVLAHQLAKLGEVFIQGMIMTKTPWPRMVSAHWNFFKRELHSCLATRTTEQALSTMALYKHTENFINDDRILSYVTAFLARPDAEVDFRPDETLPEDYYAL